MKVAVIQNYGDIDQIKIIEKEQPQLSSKEVRVKVESAGLNPKDILIRKGKFKRFTGNKFPLGIGYDFSGRIEASKHSSFQKGDKVFGMLNGWKGRSCAEYISVKPQELYLLPEGTSFEAGAGIPLAGQTALQAIRDLGKLKKGDKILINGASGGVGTLAIQIAKILGAEVTTISSSKNKDFCKSLGADIAISYEETQLTEIDSLFEVFFDVFGNYSFPKVAHVLSSNGRYITTVPTPSIFKEQFFNLFRRKKAKMVVVKSKSIDLKWLHEQIATGKLQPMLDKVFPFHEIPQAQKHIESKRAKGKVVVKIQHSTEV